MKHRSDAPRSSTGGAILGMDLLRIAAACAVLFHHLAWWEWAGFRSALPRGIPSFPVWGPWAAWGWVGVATFFVLSGFVIAFSAARNSALSFARNRFLRLYPTIWVCATITLLFRALANGESLHSLRSPWMRTVTMAAKAGWIDSVYWTLRIELIFYILLIGLLTLNRFRSLQAVMTVLSSAGTILWLLALLNHFGLVHGHALGELVRSYLHADWPDYLLLRTAPFFATGVALWLLLLEGVTASRCTLLAISIIGGCVELYFHARQIRLDADVSGMPYSAIIPILLWLLSVLAIVLSVQWNEAFSRRISRRSAHAIRVLALLTFPFYLLHQVPGFAIMRLSYRWVPGWCAFLLAGLWSIGAAYLVHRFAELPLHRGLRKLLGGGGSKPMPATTLP